MMASKPQPTAVQETALKSNIIGKAGRLFIRKSLIIAIGASLVLPACKSHKHCDAYSNSTIRKNLNGSAACSVNQNKPALIHTI
jgi:hypothetical protein